MTYDAKLQGIEEALVCYRADGDLSQIWTLATIAIWKSYFTYIQWVCVVFCCG